MSTYPLTAVDGSTLAALFDQKGMHVLAFATCFGVNLWQTVSGGVANKVSFTFESAPPVALRPPSWVRC